MEELQQVAGQDFEILFGCFSLRHDYSHRNNQTLLSLLSAVSTKDGELANQYGNQVYITYYDFMCICATTLYTLLCCIIYANKDILFEN